LEGEERKKRRREKNESIFQNDRSIDGRDGRCRPLLPVVLFPLHAPSTPLSTNRRPIPRRSTSSRSCARYEKLPKKGDGGLQRQKEKQSPLGAATTTKKRKRPMLNSLFLSRPFPLSLKTNPQHVKVGIVGGSDLVKISEQLGENSEWGGWRGRERRS